MKVRPLFFASALTLATLASTPSPASADEPTMADSATRFAGNYRFAGGDTQRLARDSAIDKATESMFFITRGVARGRVKEKTEIWASVGFSFRNGFITTTMSKLPSATSPASGSTVPYNMGSDDLRLAQRIGADGKLVQSFSGSDATRTNTYVLSPDGRTLTVSVVVTSAKLPRPICYALTYVRA